MQDIIVNEWMCDRSPWDGLCCDYCR